MELKYLMPTRVLMGKECVAQYAGEFASFGKKALVVTGARSAKACGALDDVLAALSKNGQTGAVYDKVKSNPTVASVYEGASFARAEKVDFVIAIGGGSPMDAAKAIALLARQDIPEADLFAGKYSADVLPMVLIPTTAGTGSEVTQYAILTNDRAETKTSIATPSIFPKLALLDAKYLAALSRVTTVNTAIDALSHSVEGMLSVRANAVSDALAGESIRLIASCFQDLGAGTLSAEQREKLLLASTLGGIVIANTGTTAVHAMGYSLTYFKDIDHGRANGLLLAEFLKFVQKQNPDLVQRILAHLGAKSLSSFRSTLDRLLGDRETLTADEMKKFSAKAIASKNIANCSVVPKEEDILSMYVASFDSVARNGRMPGSHAADVETVKLDDYIAPLHFRTIPVKLKSTPGGSTEIYVEMEVTPSFAAKMKFPVPWDGKIYGFVHDNNRIASVFVGDMARAYESRRIYLNDWGDRFFLTFESGDKSREVSFFVTPEEVLNLLDNCYVLVDIMYGNQ